MNIKDLVLTALASTFFAEVSDAAPSYNKSVTASASTHKPIHKLRVHEPNHLGIDSVKQLTGYLDIEDIDSKSFFFWFFEARNTPEKAPLILWLNGGPGCSSLNSMALEIGPSKLTSDLQWEHNQFSWNNDANIIFLDQPVNVGFSHSGPVYVDNSIDAGKDVVKFIEIFFENFPQYNRNGFHLAGESYAGHYIPTIAAEILTQQNLTFGLSSIVVGNGLFDIRYQGPSYVEMSKISGLVPYYKVQRLERQSMLCKSASSLCYANGDLKACKKAQQRCEQMILPYLETGMNPFDMRRKCLHPDSCYAEFGLVQDYFNKPEVKQEIGAEGNFVSCSNYVREGFKEKADATRKYHTLIGSLLDSGIPVLVYAGDQDFQCNYIGQQKWVNELEWSGRSKFQKSAISEWTAGNSALTAGLVQNYHNFTYLRIHDAGHMVGMDQPQIAYRMLKEWLVGNYGLKQGSISSSDFVPPALPKNDSLTESETLIQTEEKIDTLGLVKELLGDQKSLKKALNEGFRDNSTSEHILDALKNILINQDINGGNALETSKNTNKNTEGLISDSSNVNYGSGEGPMRKEYGNYRKNSYKSSATPYTAHDAAQQFSANSDDEDVGDCDDEDFELFSFIGGSIDYLIQSAIDTVFGILSW